MAISGISPLSYLHPDVGQDRGNGTVVWLSADDIHYDDRAVSEIASALAAVTDGSLAVDDQTVTDAVAEAVSDAAYWQEPGADDLLLANPRIVDALRPIARLVVDSAVTSWWTDPLDLENQFFVSWLWKKKQTRADPPLLTGAAERRAKWRAEALAEERHATRHRPPEHEAQYGGNWWSTPVFAGLVTTTPRLPNDVPAQLVFVEDPMGMDRARVARLQPSRDARIYEVTQPSDFVDLVARYPLPLDRARRHEWFQATGSRGPWLIPDWAAVGEDYDAVHLTVLGYLATAGRALPVLDQFTVLAGWEPSETWWLNDVLQEATEPTTWKESKSGRWRPIP
jgi:hypothetical protein